MTPTRTQIVACWLLLTVAMLGLGWFFRHTIPPLMAGAYAAVGVGPGFIGLFIIWCAAAYVGWGPSIRAALARRRRAAIR
ncbi:MAG: hypothetical protein MIL41_04785 [Hyphomicrobiales bacterium]|jgi:membrane protein YdbS with pleckstrin-like domain